MSGTDPYSYSWDFDSFGFVGWPTATIDFGESGTYSYTLGVFNCEGGYSDVVSGEVAVDCEVPQWTFYLPLIVHDGS